MHRMGQNTKIDSVHSMHTKKLQAPDSLFSDLHKFEFDDHPLSDDQTVMASVRMFRDSGLASTFRIDDRVSYIVTITPMQHV